MKQIILMIFHYACIMWVFLLMGFMFVPHDSDHTRTEHLFPIGVGLLCAYATRPKNIGA